MAGPPSAQHEGASVASRQPSAAAGGRAAASVVQVGGVDVIGVDVDRETRCRHYHGPLDIVALRFRCCGDWYPCIDCHTELAGHAAEVWPLADRDAVAALCGACGHRLTVREYLACDSACPACGAAFNPGCALHHHLYFEMPSSGAKPGE